MFNNFIFLRFLDISCNKRWLLKSLGDSVTTEVFFQGQEKFEDHKRQSFSLMLFV